MCADALFLSAAIVFHAMFPFFSFRIRVSKIQSLRGHYVLAHALFLVWGYWARIRVVMEIPTSYAFQLGGKLIASRIQYPYVTPQPARADNGETKLQGCIMYRYAVFRTEKVFGSDAKTDRSGIQAVGETQVGLLKSNREDQDIPYRLLL